MQSQYAVLNHLNPYGGHPDPGGIYHSHNLLPNPIYSQSIVPISHLHGYQHKPKPRFVQFKMAAPPSQEEMAAMQRLSDNYAPDIEGPLVGSKQPISTLSAEYANADPVYVQKTTAFAHKFSHYRVMKGDGNCGWRAIAFLYFENLYCLGDRSKIDSEMARMMSLNNMLIQAGYSELIFADFSECTIELLEKTAEAILNGFGEQFLTDYFNDESHSSAIIMHFRLLAGAWMKQNPDSYAGFLPMSIQEYINSYIDPFKVEIEHTGIQALFDVAIGPAGFNLEITMLDRTPGSEANVIPFHSATPMYQPAPTLCLLFKPDHYDILYAAGPRGVGLPGNAGETQIVGRAEILPEYQSFSNYNLYAPPQMALEQIPGLSTIPAYSMPHSSSSYAPTMNQSYSFSLPSTSPPTLVPSSNYQTISVPQPAASTPSPISPITSPPSVQSPTASSPGMHPPTSPFTSEEKQKDPIRLVHQTSMAAGQPSLLSTPFKNSEYNRIHFANENFHPEEYHYKESTKSRSRKPH